MEGGLSRWASAWTGEPAACAATAVLLLLGAAAWLLLLHGRHNGDRITSPRPTLDSLPVIRRTVVRTQLRAAALLESEKRGVLEADQLVLVLEERQIAPGRVRARVGRLSLSAKDSAECLGWLSTATERGDNILVPLSPAEAAAAWRWRGLTLAERPPSHDDAVAAFHRAWAANEAEIDRAPTTSAKLRHDAEQLEWLVRHGAVSEEGAAVAHTLRETERQLFVGGRARGDGGEVMRIPTVTLAALDGWYRARLYTAPSDRIPGGALHVSTDWVRVLKQYRATAPTSYVVVDDILSSVALDSLVRYCRDSTVFDDFLYKGGYVGTSLTNGLGTGLVLQIAEELRARLPALLEEHPLRHAWVYKCDNSESATAIAPHADEAAVNINIWLVDGWQSSANRTARDTNGGGLKMWLKEVPLEFDFQAFNREPDRLLHWLSDTPEPVQELKITHRANRAVIFNSALVHQSDVPPGTMRGCSFEDRRMNLTLLFGQRCSN